MASPLSRLENEARMIDKSRLSSQSSESLATTGGLLDKLNLNDEDWKDPPDYSDHASYYDGDESSGEIGSNIHMFESLRSVLGSQKGHAQSAVNRVMELGKKVNTVEQSKPKVMKRNTVQSIHLDSLLQDEDDDDEEEEDDDHDDHYDENYPDTNSAESTQTYKEEELSFIPQTPTRSMKTPNASPRNLLTPRSQVEAFSPMFKHKYSNSLVQSVKSNSSIGECVPETFLYNRPSEETVFNGPHHTHTQSHDISSHNETVVLNRSASFPVRKPSVKQSQIPSQELPPVPKPTTPKMITPPPSQRYEVPQQQNLQYISNFSQSTPPAPYSNVPFHKRKLQFKRNHQQAYNQIYPQLHNAENEFQQHYQPPPSTPPMNRAPPTSQLPVSQTITAFQGFSPGNPYAPRMISPQQPQFQSQMPQQQQQQQQQQHPYQIHYQSPQQPKNWPAGIHPKLSPRVLHQYMNGPQVLPPQQRQHPDFSTINQYQHSNNFQRSGYPQSTGYYGVKSPNKKKPTTFQDVDLSTIIPR
ncbi:hypothetical protein CANINC_000649 [Pichia inconspicua]|uniref:Uncharacterized protein n=1 Tax=Pichia inconspicua TaxID=52247 RepID=A0A4T0X5Z5_9ASCO|nr:hypothetical protein CANINC_000649 [[Candida] inconspicua]